MKPESFDEQLSRFDLMCEGDPTFDLSDNDIAALLAVRTEMRIMARSTLASQERIKELEAKLAAKWISVDERLPEATQGQVEGLFIISDDVLCYWPADGGIHEACNYDHEDHRWSLVHKAFEEPDCEPTHWQPLPPPPSGAKGETKP